MKSPVKVLVLGICLLIAAAIAWKFRSMLIEAEPTVIEAQKERAAQGEAQKRTDPLPK